MRLRLTVVGAALALTLLPAVPALALAEREPQPGRLRSAVRDPARAGLLCRGLLSPLRHGHHQDCGRKHAPPRSGFPSSIGVSALAPMLWYVSKAKVLGANYGVLVALPFANASIEAPAFQLGRKVDTGVADMLLRPLDLGWHTTRADIAAGFQVYVPTGRYEQGANDNLGKGMWTYEPFVGRDRLLRRQEDLQSLHHGLLGDPWEQGGQRRQGRTDPHAQGGLGSRSSEAG